MDNDDALNSVLQDDAPSGLMSVVKELAFSMPGVDEAMSFAAVMQYVRFEFMAK